MLKIEVNRQNLKTGGRRRGVADNGLGAGTVEREARRGILPRHPPVILNTVQCLNILNTQHLSHPQHCLKPQALRDARLAG